MATPIALPVAGETGYTGMHNYLTKNYTNIPCTYIANYRMHTYT